MDRLVFQFVRRNFRDARLFNLEFQKNNFLVLDFLSIGTDFGFAFDDYCCPTKYHLGCWICMVYLQFRMETVV